MSENVETTDAVGGGGGEVSGGTGRDGDRVVGDGDAVARRREARFQVLRDIVGPADEETAFEVDWGGRRADGESGIERGWDAPAVGEGDPVGACGERADAGDGEVAISGAGDGIAVEGPLVGEGQRAGEEDPEGGGIAEVDPLGDGPGMECDGGTASGVEERVEVLVEEVDAGG
jgi:hypothetical protein